jgi:hypothetical protein
MKKKEMRKKKKKRKTTKVQQAKFTGRSGVGCTLFLSKSMEHPQQLSCKSRVVSMSGVGGNWIVASACAVEPQQSTTQDDNDGHRILHKYSLNTDEALLPIPFLRCSKQRHQRTI